MLPTFSESWISLLIMNELKRIEPSLNLQREDKRLLQICCADFRNYSDYLVNLTIGDYHVEEDKEMEKIVEFIQMWVKGWWKKYKERVKVTIMKSPRFEASKTRQKGIKMMYKFTEKEISDINKAVIQTLIKNGEVCCTEILADSIFKGVLGRYSEKMEWTQEKKLNLMASIIREAKRMSYVHGPLVFIKPDKKYYELREFRDDNNATSLV